MTRFHESGWIYDDGGRADAGYRGETGDCAARAIAIATDIRYEDVYHALVVFAETERPRGKRKRSHPRTGVHVATMHRYLASLGWDWVPTMQIGSGTTVHLRADELPSGRIIARCSRHYVAVIDGVAHDTHDSTRDGTRAVYGYWVAPTS